MFTRKIDGYIQINKGIIKITPRLFGNKLMLQFEIYLKSYPKSLLTINLLTKEVNLSDISCL